ncbi:NAD-dependent epimerase/dehydratase family protein, partial [Rhodovulum sulfidophilum]|nr:NAD-dependent epimerase/dehydratase family protein [Rhodovulum sulfidophilum]
MSKPVPVLVTGGAGYIGSHICRRLSDAGYLPV